MYSVRQLKKGLRWSVTQPNLVLREANRLYHRRLYDRSYNPAGVNVMAEDWDTLVVLDGCRYDMFEEQHDLPGTLTKRTSRASHTMEFIFGNFHGRSFPDTVYVTGSPILHRGLGEKYQASFHDVINVWAEDGWDERNKTVLAETMTKYVLDAAEKYPNKRIIGHYMQPHYPFVGYDDLTQEVTVPDPAVIESDIWMLLMTGEIDVPKERIWEAYRHNLDYALAHVEPLLDELTGKTVITADHGNMVGERSRPIPVTEWGHPPGVYTPQLVQVPWLEYESGPRREIVAGESRPATETSSDVEDDVVADRLHHLGYAE